MSTFVKIGVVTTYGPWNMYFFRVENTRTTCILFCGVISFPTSRLSRLLEYTREDVSDNAET